MAHRTRMRPPGLAERAWHARLGTTPPVLTATTAEWHADWVRHLPQRWQRLHRAYAAAYGHRWAPCVLCGHDYGGHQFAGTVPDPAHQPTGDGTARGVSICPACTKQRAAAGLDTDI